MRVLGLGGPSGRPDAYRNPDPTGSSTSPVSAARRSSSSLGKEDRRGGGGRENLDIGASTTFEVHVTLLGADRYGVENMANLSHVPPSGAACLRRSRPLGERLGRTMPSSRRMVIKAV